MPPAYTRFRHNRERSFTDGVKLKSSGTLVYWDDHNDSRYVDALVHLFYYAPLRKRFDRVVCCRCGHEEHIDNTQPYEEWDITNFLQQHIASSKRLDGVECPLALVVMSQGVSGVLSEADKRREFERMPNVISDPLSSTALKFRRLFFVKYPHDDDDRFYIDSDLLAKAGFIYDPDSYGSDRTVCVYCKCSLEEWDRDDDPLAEHRQNAPDYCYFLAALAKQQQKTATSTEHSQTFDTSNVLSQLDELELDLSDHNQQHSDTEIREIRADEMKQNTTSSTRDANNSRSKRRERKTRISKQPLVYINQDYWNKLPDEDLYEELEGKRASSAPPPVTAYVADIDDIPAKTSAFDSTFDDSILGTSFQDVSPNKLRTRSQSLNATPEAEAGKPRTDDKELRKELQTQTTTESSLVSPSAFSVDLELSVDFPLRSDPLDADLGSVSEPEPKKNESTSSSGKSDDEIEQSSKSGAVLSYSNNEEFMQSTFTVDDESDEYIPENEHSSSSELETDSRRRRNLRSRLASAGTTSPPNTTQQASKSSKKVTIPKSRPKKLPSAEIFIPQESELKRTKKIKLSKASPAPLSAVDVTDVNLGDYSNVDELEGGIVPLLEPLTRPKSPAAHEEVTRDIIVSPVKAQAKKKHSVKRSAPNSQSIFDNDSDELLFGAPASTHSSPIKGRFFNRRRPSVEPEKVDHEELHLDTPSLNKENKAQNERTVLPEVIASEVESEVQTPVEIYEDALDGSKVVDVVSTPPQSMAGAPARISDDEKSATTLETSQGEEIDINESNAVSSKSLQENDTEEPVIAPRRRRGRPSKSKSEASASSQRNNVTSKDATQGDENLENEEPRPFVNEKPANKKQGKLRTNRTQVSSDDVDMKIHEPLNEKIETNQPDNNSENLEDSINEVELEMNPGDFLQSSIKANDDNGTSNSTSEHPVTEATSIDLKVPSIRSKENDAVTSKSDELSNLTNESINGNTPRESNSTKKKRKRKGPDLSIEASEFLNPPTSRLLRRKSQAVVQPEKAKDQKLEKATKQRKRKLRDESDIDKLHQKMRKETSSSSSHLEETKVLVTEEEPLPEGVSKNTLDESNVTSVSDSDYKNEKSKANKRRLKQSDAMNLSKSKKQLKKRKVSKAEKKSDTKEEIPDIVQQNATKVDSTTKSDEKLVENDFLFELEEDVSEDYNMYQQDLQNLELEDLRVFEDENEIQVTRSSDEGQKEEEEHEKPQAVVDIKDEGSTSPTKVSSTSDNPSAIENANASDKVSSTDNSSDTEDQASENSLSSAEPDSRLPTLNNGKNKRLTLDEIDTNANGSAESSQLLAKDDKTISNDAETDQENLEPFEDDLHVSESPKEAGSRSSSSSKEHEVTNGEAKVEGSSRSKIRPSSDAIGSVAKLSSERRKKVISNQRQRTVDSSSTFKIKHIQTSTKEESEKVVEKEILVTRKEELVSTSPEIATEPGVNGMEKNNEDDKRSSPATGIAEAESPKSQHITSVEIGKAIFNLPLRSPPKNGENKQLSEAFRATRQVSKSPTKSKDKVPVTWPLAKVDKFKEEIEYFKTGAQYLHKLANSNTYLHEDDDGELTHFISCMPADEGEMTIEEWVNHNANHYARELWSFLDTIRTDFEKQHERAIQAIVDLSTDEESGDEEDDEGDDEDDEEEDADEEEAVIQHRADVTAA